MTIPFQHHPKTPTTDLPIGLGRSAGWDEEVPGQRPVEFVWALKFVKDTRWITSGWWFTWFIYDNIWKIAIYIWLVATGTWLLFFHSIGNVITPIDFHIFSEGLKPPTSDSIVSINPAISTWAAGNQTWQWAIYHLYLIFPWTTPRFLGDFPTEIPHVWMIFLLNGPCSPGFHTLWSAFTSLWNITIRFVGKLTLSIAIFQFANC